MKKWLAILTNPASFHIFFIVHDAPVHCEPRGGERRDAVKVAPLHRAGGRRTAGAQRQAVQDKNS